MTIKKIGQQAKQVARLLGNLSTKDKNTVLGNLSLALEQRKEDIFIANHKDLEYLEQQGITGAFYERLTITENTINSMIEGLKNVIQLEDPIGLIQDDFNRPNGLRVQKISVPMGVVAIIYESRPNVTIDAFALTFKSGNAVILKGGKEAIHSNQIFVEIIQETLKNANISQDAVQLFTPKDREETKTLMKCNEYIDLLIPRGSAALIKAVVEESTIPVIETGAGNCHVYIDQSANIDMAISITYNAKIQRPSVCNSCETILVHETIAESFLTKLNQVFKDKVSIYGDRFVQQYMDDALEATDDEYGKEFNDYIVAIKVVSSLEEAINHINMYSTSHSEVIVTDDNETAEIFLKNIDSAAVYHNTSSRFTDGFEFGFGAEIGISTQKLHVRGPMGLTALTSYKYLIFGNGQIR